MVRAARSESTRKRFGGLLVEAHAGTLRCRDRNAAMCRRGAVSRQLDSVDSFGPLAGILHLASEAAEGVFLATSSFFDSVSGGSGLLGDA